MARLNVTIPDELYNRIERWRERINLSRICQEALARELEKLELVPEDVREMEKALSRLGEQKAKIERSCFRKGVYDGLEWAREADYPVVKRWGEQSQSSVVWEEVLHGPASERAAAHSGEDDWHAQPYAEGWIAGVQQFWNRAKPRL